MIDDAFPLGVHRSLTFTNIVSRAAKGKIRLCDFPCRPACSKKGAYPVPKRHNQCFPQWKGKNDVKTCRKHGKVLPTLFGSSRQVKILEMSDRFLPDL